MPDWIKLRLISIAHMTLDAWEQADANGRPSRRQLSLKSAIFESDPAAAAVLAETEEWQKIMAQDFERELDVYLDIKSPHAYLAVRPSLEVARDYKVRVNFLPYTLSYVALGVTTSKDADNKRRPANPAADRKARMYYAAARQYARF